MLPLHDYAALPDQERGHLQALLGRLRGLEEALRLLALRGGALVDIVTQDEYTHDIIFQLGASAPERHVVFDAT